MVTRRTIFELKKARNRAHLLEGLGVALANIDEMIELIKQSATPQEAKEGLLLAKAWHAGIGHRRCCKAQAVMHAVLMI